MKKFLILVHRYLGILLSLLFLMWFVSGIAMIYARGMPSLTPDERLKRLPVIDFSRAELPLSAALAAAGFEEVELPRAQLLTIMDRPAYRFGGITVFADTGEVLEEITAEQAAGVVAGFLNEPGVRLTFGGTLTTPDQWTIGQASLLPLHKFIVDDGARTELYVSGIIGEVVVQTTRATRALAWVAAIPHWLYFAPLRLRPTLWSGIIIWTSILGTISVALGLLLALLQYRRARPHIPYSGWLRWHYITGAIFGVFTLTWVFSGLLSMEPWDWAQPGAGLGAGMQEALSGGPIEPSAFPPIDAGKFASLAPDAKEVEFLRIQGDPYYVVTDSAAARTLIAAESFEVRSEPFTEESLLSRLKEPNPDAPVVESTLLTHYDSYYYSNQGRAPLPVLRVKFGDPYETWFYVDPKMGQIVARYHRLGRVERWIYHGFHSLDFGFWYNRRPLWDIGVIGLSLGGAALSAIGVVISLRRLRGLTRLYQKR